MRIFLLLVSTLVILAGPTLRADEPRPNFVVVFIDDMGQQDLGAFGGLRDTPHIDRLALEGVRFTQFYVASPICSPSRCGLLTGQWPQRWGISSFLAHREANANRGMAQWLDTKAPTLARDLKSLGYATGHFGKWHLGGQRDVGEAPLITEYGFDSSLTNFEGLGDRVLPVMGGVDGRKEEKLPLGVGSERLGRGEITWAPRHEVTGKFAQGAIGFIERARAEGKPFYVNLWPDDVHSPFSPPPGESGNGSKRHLYRGVLKGMDAQLGELFTHIRNDPELLANTLVLVASDNGPEPGAGRTGGLRGRKGQLYEGGVRSPLIAWGGLVATEARGSTNDVTILSALDIRPSLVKLAGGTVTDSDGLEMSEAFTGHAKPERSGPLVWRRPPDRPGPADAPLPDLAIRQGSWKLLMQEDGTGAELYDLKSDRGEEINVADENADVVERLRDELTTWTQTLRHEQATQKR